MSKFVIISDGRYNQNEITEATAIAIGAGYVEVESEVNAKNRTNGLQTGGLDEIVVMLDVTGTMPAGTEIVITPYINGYGALSTITETLATVTDGTIETRVSNLDRLRDADYLKITYRFIQDATTPYTVDMLNLQVKQGTGGIISDLITGVQTLLTSILTIFQSVFQSATDSLRTEEIDPIPQNYVYDTVAEVVNGTDGTYNYYLDMDTYKKIGIQCILNGGSGTVTVTVDITLQADGTAPASCTYEPATVYVFTVASLTSTGVLLDDYERTSMAKYVRINVVAATGGANDADWTIFTKRLY